MPVGARKQTEAMEEICALMKLMIEKQEDFKNEMKSSLEEIKLEIRTSQEEMKQELKEMMVKIRENLKGEFYNGQDEMMLLELKLTKEDVKEVEEQMQQTVQLVHSQVQLVQDQVQQVKEQMQQEVQQLQQQIKNIASTGVVSGCGTPVTVMKPPTFDGKVPWVTYLRQFEAAANGNNWSPTERARALVLALRGKAMEVLRNIPEEKLSDYESIIMFLEMRYGETHLQEVYKAQLHGRRQKYNESLQEYEADIVHLINLSYPAYPEEIKQELAVGSFIEGLRDPDMSQALRMAKLKKISEALAYALQFEIAKRTSRTQARLGRTNYPPKDGNPNNNLTRVIQELQEIIRNQQTEKDNRITFRRRNIIRCWKCGKDGHIQRNCSSFQASSSSAEDSQFKGRDLAKCYQEPSTTTIRVSRLQNNGSSLVVPGNVCGRECEMVLDTGSTHTIVRPNIISHCKIFRPEKNYILETANGEVIPVQGIHEARITLGTTTFTHVVFVADIMDEVILGLDIMKNQKFVLDLPQRVLRTNNEEIVMRFPKSNETTIREVVLAEDVTLPPSSESIIQARFKDSEEGEDVSLYNTRRIKGVHRNYRSHVKW